MDTQTENTKGELAIIDRTGDTKVIWDRHRPDEVENARETFKKMRAKGYLAYKVKKDGDKGEQIHEFEADAERIILAPAMVGG